MSAADGFNWTCISCGLAFNSAEAQREHYVTDLHRYNAKRRIANLPPVSAQVFEEKVSERQAPVVEEERLFCKACNKSFTAQATYDNHVNSKKHKETVIKAAAKIDLDDPTSKRSQSPPPKSVSQPHDEDVPQAGPSSQPEQVQEIPFESSGDAKLDLLVAKRLKVAPPVAISDCLFCKHRSASAQDNVDHMRNEHSFVIPDQEYLVDLDGLLSRLGEEVGTWNVCVYCHKGYGGNIDLDTKGMSDDELRKRASKGVEAVRHHMMSKSHCKLPYDTEEQRLDVADFYDFRPSYPDYAEKQARKAARRAAKQAAQEEWEDVDDDGRADETMLVDGESDATSDEGSDDGDSDVPGSEVMYGDTVYELVLPSGARLGHRSLRPYYSQNASALTSVASNTRSHRPNNKPSPHSLALLSLIPKDKAHGKPLYESGLVKSRGGNVVQARNKGEAKEASKGERLFLQQRKHDDYKLRVGFTHNNQKHFRDPLLQ